MCFRKPKTASSNALFSPQPKKEEETSQETENIHIKEADIREF